MSALDISNWRTRFNKFRQDKSGGVLIMFAGGAFMLTLIAAGAIELHRRNLATAELQNAADSAALAGKQRQVALATKMSKGASQAQGKTYAMNMFNQAMAQSKSFKSTPTATYTWNTDGSLTVDTNPKYEVLMGNILPIQFQKLRARATADFANSIPTEVAMVLDTTASMFNKDGRPETRFTLMRNAAKKFTHQLFNAAEAAADTNLVRISVVPWATSVNVRGGAPAAADFTGDALVTSIPDKGTQLAVAAPMGRASVSGTGAAAFQPVQWRGCISGAGEAATYTDSAMAAFQALNINAAPTYNITVKEGPNVATPLTTCTCDATAPIACTPGTGTQGFHRLIEKAVPQISNAAFLFDKRLDKQGSPNIEKAQCTQCLSTTCTTATVQLPDCTAATTSYTVPYCFYYGEGGRRNSFNPTGFACTDRWDGCFETGKGPTADRAVPACVADPNEPSIVSATVPWCEQYYLSTSKDWKGLNSDGTVPEIAGPNLNCPAPMLGLSGNRRQVLEYLDRLTPVPGGTHADVGLRWGLRSLSSANSWPTFFGLTKAPGAFGTGTQKVMILITDGENEQAQDYPGYWGCNRIDTDHVQCAGSPTNAELDTKMQGWCDSIRNTYKVSLYAIAVNFANPAAVARLQACAGNPSNVFSVDAADLNSVLAGIANRVMAMRLVQ